MKIAKLSLLLPVVILASMASAQAGGDATYYHRESVTRCVKQKRHCPLGVVGRAAETFLHWPQIFAETIEGDRALVNKRGVLGTRELPVEERIISPED
jgi:hypothetical protein